MLPDAVDSSFEDLLHKNEITYVHKICVNLLQRNVNLLLLEASARVLTAFGKLWNWQFNFLGSGQLWNREAFKMALKNFWILFWKIP